MKKNAKPKKIGHIKLSGHEELIASLIDDEKLELKMFFKTDTYRGPARGFRFYFFDENWAKFKKLVEKIDKVYEQG